MRGDTVYIHVCIVADGLYVNSRTRYSWLGANVVASIDLSRSMVASTPRDLSHELRDWRHTYSQLHNYILYNYVLAII